MTKTERIALLESRVAQLEMRLLALEAQRIAPQPQTQPYWPSPTWLPPNTIFGPVTAVPDIRYLG